MKRNESNIIETNEITNVRLSKSFPNSPNGNEFRKIKNEEKYFNENKLSERRINAESNLLREILITISIELSEGKEVSIPIYKGQKAEEVAREFCHQFNLSDEILPPLIEAINQKIYEGLNINFNPESLESEERKTQKNRKVSFHTNRDSEQDDSEESSKLHERKGITDSKKNLLQKQIYAKHENKPPLNIKNESNFNKITKRLKDNNEKTNSIVNKSSERNKILHPPDKILNIEFSEEHSSKINKNINPQSRDKEKFDQNFDSISGKNNSCYFSSLKAEGPLLSPHKASKPQSELNTEPHIPTEVANESFEQWQHQIIMKRNLQNINTLENEEIKEIKDIKDIKKIKEIKEPCNNLNNTHLISKQNECNNNDLNNNILDSRKFISKRRGNEQDEINKLKLNSKHSKKITNDLRDSFIEKSEKENFKLKNHEKDSNRGKNISQIIKGQVGEKASSRLYNAGMKKLMIQENICKENEQLTIEHNMSEATFRPKISFNPHLNIRRSSVNIGIHLIKSGEKLKEKKEQNRAYNNLIEQNKNTFRPKISRKSNRIAIEKNRTLSMEISQGSSRGLINKFEILYEDAIRRKELNNKIKAFNFSEYTFKPRITGLSRALSQSQCEKLSLLERLQIPIGGIKNNLEEIDFQVDSKNGRALFQPKICRPPLYERNTARMPIGDYLYSTQKKIFANREKVKNEMELSNMDEHYKLFTLAKSERIINKLKAEAFNSIFSLLDQDDNGTISSKTLPKEICTIYNRLFVEMEETCCTLNLEEFIIASNNLFKLLSLPEKGAILRFAKQSKKFEPLELTFRVELFSQI